MAKFLIFFKNKLSSPQDYMDPEVKSIQQFENLSKWAQILTSWINETDLSEEKQFVMNQKR